MRTRTLGLAVGLMTAMPAWALEGPAPTAVATPGPMHAVAKGKNIHLGKIEVQGVGPLVQTLREIKVAVKRPFDNDPAHFDDMVCRLGDDELGSHLDQTLECGTQGWFSMRRNAFSYGGVLQNGSAAGSTLGHPWHVVRTLDPKQLRTLRALLRQLPPPGNGEMRVIDDQPAPLEGND